MTGINVIIKRLRGLEWHFAKEAADEMERLEKERFKYETALMLIANGSPQAASIAKAAIGDRP